MPRPGVSARRRWCAGDDAVSRAKLAPVGSKLPGQPAPGLRRVAEDLGASAFSFPVGRRQGNERAGGEATSKSHKGFPRTKQTAQAASAISCAPPAQPRVKVRRRVRNLDCRDERPEHGEDSREIVGCPAAGRLATKTKPNSASTVHIRTVPNSSSAPRGSPNRSWSGPASDRSAPSDVQPLAPVAAASSQPGSPVQTDLVTVGHAAGRSSTGSPSSSCPSEPGLPERFCDGPLVRCGST